MLNAFLRAEIGDSLTILDLGCGPGNVLASSNLPSATEITGVDLHQASLDEARRSGYQKVVNMNIQEFLNQVDSDSYDVVTALDVIEHLDFPNGHTLIDEMKRVAKVKVIVMTPNGLVSQGPSPDNPYQEHKSGWTIPDFEGHGFTKFYGLHGLRFLRKSYGLPKLRPQKLGYLVSRFSQPLVTSRACRAFQFLAIFEK